MRSLKRLLCAVVGCVVVVAMTPQRGNAIPAFARRMGAKCTQCHFRPGELKYAGKDFLRRGFREFEEETPDMEPGTQLPEGEEPLTLTDIMSVLGEHEFEQDLNGGAEFEGGEFEIMAGAPVSPEFSFLTEVEFKVEDEEVEVEEFYGQYTSDTMDRYWTARVGQFQPFLLTTNQSGAARMALSRPVVYSGRAANGNMFRPRNRLRGLEVGRVCGDWYNYVGIGNGQGQNEDDNHMDVYLTSELNLDDDGSSLGFWAYFGELPLEGEEGDFRDDYHRLGIVGNCTSERNKFTGAFLWGENTNDPEFGGGDLENSGWFVMGQHLCSSDTAVYARWDDFEREVSPSGEEEETDGLTFGVQWWASTYIRIVGELQFLEEDGEDEDSFTLGFLWSY